MESTCYASKLQKHLTICNARQQEVPPYIKYNVNAPPETNPLKQPLSEIPSTQIDQIINKVNLLFDTYLNGKIDTLPEREIHPAVMDEFLTEGRTESSLRHLRQASKLMHIMEDESLVKDHTCYVELGAGKGHLSYFAWHAWCPATSGSSILLVERASLRHKRDNKIRNLLDNSNKVENIVQKLSPELCTKNEMGSHKNINNYGNKDDCCETKSGQNQSGNNNINEESFRLRADLAHLILDLVPAVQKTESIVGFAKHLCGVATDFSLRCLSSANTLPKTRGILIATCCHHRCSSNGYVAHKHLMELGIDKREFNIMTGIVSWATCGDGRSRDKRGERIAAADVASLSRRRREEVGRRAKAILDWGRVLYLKECGFDARLTYFIPDSVSLENLCIVAKKN
ncbi:tRNA:m(4)X modification enzyme TRM13 homolog isoform X2 [Pieris rapae]|uniref:tRNA:m(4)X modification enzyme TRM13 homolog isoform X2 n=1 Tax=Pieris rapae TaxID=64459 RepID=UPI001E27FF9F|nr:tRNA:m(4)X modification enzyme TRM13 homolog isoform X2 [Pieris rapae]